MMVSSRCARGPDDESSQHLSDESSAHAVNGLMPALESNDPAVIQSELSRRGIGFEQWPAEQGLPEGADQATILQTMPMPLPGFNAMVVTPRSTRFG